MAASSIATPHPLRLPTAQNERVLRELHRIWPVSQRPEAIQKLVIEAGAPDGAAAMAQLWDLLPTGLRSVALGRVFGLPIFPVEITSKLAPLMPAAKCEEELFLPVEAGERHLVVVTPVPWRVEVIRRNALRLVVRTAGAGAPAALPSRVSVGYCSPEQFEKAVQSLRWCQQPGKKEADDEVARLAGAQEALPELDLTGEKTAAEKDQPTDEVLRPVFEFAVANAATDIQFQPDIDPVSRANFLRSRVRISGVYQDIQAERRDGRDWSEVLKARLAGLCKSPDKGAGVDGKFRLRIRKVGSVLPVRIDVRFQALRIDLGQSISLRLLDKTKRLPSAAELFTYAPLVGRWIRDFLPEPSGALLVCGPTGSGKTTTLNVLIAELDAVAQNIISIEDPPEYQLPGIAQVSIETIRTGTAWGDAAEDPWSLVLRAALRKDPDTLLVGEIRDRTVADIAAQAVVTGHQVFSTLHVDTVTGLGLRMKSLGIDPTSFYYALRIVTSQRLVSRCCPNCARSVTFEESGEAATWLQQQDLPQEWLDDLMSGRFQPRIAVPGARCPVCSGRGYVGAVTVMEGLDVADPDLQQFLAEQANLGRDVQPFDLEAFMRKKKWPQMPVSALRAIFPGATDRAAAEQSVKLRSEVARCDREWKATGSPSWDWSVDEGAVP
jgi:type II secretory ATPase GspE/PulE/Tfp pilus assembly ATPase PilB-like protein